MSNPIKIGFFLAFPFPFTQDLSVPFGNLIRTKKLSEVVLLSPKTGVLCKVLLSKTKNSTKFGMGWRQFCTEHGLKEGDTLLFEVDHSETEPIIDVFINECFCDVVESINLV